MDSEVLLMKQYNEWLKVAVFYSTIWRISWNLTAAEAEPLPWPCCLQRGSGEVWRNEKWPLTARNLHHSSCGSQGQHYCNGTWCKDSLPGPGWMLRGSGLQCKVTLDSQRGAKGCSIIRAAIPVHTAHPPHLKGIIPFQMRSMLYWALINEGDIYTCYPWWHKSIINKHKVHSLTICLWC